jgi:actin-related protein 9
MAARKGRMEMMCAMATKMTLNGLRIRIRAKAQCFPCKVSILTRFLQPRICRELITTRFFSTAGRIVNMEAFLAFLDHVHSMLTTTYHNTPIMLMASPQWTRPDCEDIARYIFEKTKTPALCIIHSGLATQYGLKWPHMTVVDIGFEKVDVTCIYDNRPVGQGTLGYPSPDRNISGGEVFTQRLLEMLKSQDFTYDMAEQLKRSPICEVLPYAPESKDLMDLPVEAGQAVATSAAPPKSAIAGPGEGPRIVEPIARQDAEVDGDDSGAGIGADKADDDGVLDVANIVASGQTREFLAKKEKEKTEKGKSRKGARDKEAEAAAARPTRLPNPKRTRNVFHYEEVVMEDVVPEPPKPAAATAPPAESGGTNVEMIDAPAAQSLSLLPTGLEEPAPAAPKPATPLHSAPTDGSQAKTEPSTEQTSGETTADGHTIKPETETATETTDDALLAAVAPVPPPDVPIPERQAKRLRRDIEVGLERFTFAERTQIDRIVSTIYRTVQSIEDMYMRPQCWDNIVFVGNGARIRGLKENILQTLNARHLVSPSTATMFTSELPSNLATPSGTGSQTPTGSYAGAPHQLPTSSNVNPLLQAATTAHLAVPRDGAAGGAAAGGGAPGSAAGDTAAGPSHHFHSQTPTSIKLAPMPTYLGEWTKNGFEEAMFLGAQVAARLAFCIHNMDAQGLEAQRQMSLSRVDYK